VTDSSKKKSKPILLAVIVAAIGAALLYMGVQLAMVGGSFYYLLAGCALLLNALLLIKAKPQAATLYGLFLLASYIWALVEAGLDPWALLPRLGLLSAIGLWFVLPRVRRQLSAGNAAPLFSLAATRLTVLAAAALAVALVTANWSHEVNPPSAAGSGQVHSDSGDWGHYGASKAGTRYAPQQQINVANVDQLERSWEFRTGVDGTFKGTPIQIGDGLYLCTGQNIIVSLDPDSGAQRWRFDPEIDTPRFGFWDTCRGVTYYEAPAERPSAVCPQRILTATTDARLLAVNAHTGERCSDFGDNGEISLLPGMGEVKAGFYFVTSPPTIANGTLVLGGWVADNQETEEPSGVVRGFDPISGELRWAWDMGREDLSGLPEEGSSYTRGTPNVWSLTSADDELGLVYVPTGNATPDYFGGERSEAMEKYASSVVALDAATGKVRWHFQTTHHDIWDYDVPSQPTLTNITIDGTVRKAVIVPTKRGEVFVLDRETGEALTEVRELPTPQTDTPFEYTSPTQPFSVGMPAFARQHVQESDMWGITPIDQLACRLQFKKLRYEGPLTPPSVAGTLYYPGVGGGMNWGSVAVDEVNQLMVVNVLHMPSVVRLIEQKDVTEDTQFGIGGPQLGLPYAAYSMFFLSPVFAPCMRPPFGEMAVVDLASQQLLWRRPLGTAREQGPLGIKTGLPLPMGMFYQAGSIVTGGGLIFNGGVMDGRMRAIDVMSGDELWSDALPVSSQATPMSYVSKKTGRQYILVTTPGGKRAQPARENAVDTSTQDSASKGGYVIAYALPEA